MISLTFPSVFCTSKLRQNSLGVLQCSHCILTTSPKHHRSGWGLNVGLPLPPLSEMQQILVWSGFFIFLDARKRWVDMIVTYYWPGSLLRLEIVISWCSFDVENWNIYIYTLCIVLNIYTYRFSWLDMQKKQHTCIYSSHIRDLFTRCGAVSAIQRPHHREKLLRNILI